MKECISAGMSTAGIYLDTASIGLNCRYSRISISSENTGMSKVELVHTPVTEGLAFFFCPNATLVIVSLCEFFVWHRNWRVEIEDDTFGVHPVVVAALSGVESRVHGRLCAGTVVLRTLMHWITGKVDVSVLEESRVCDDNVVEIIDAVQAFGNLTERENENLLKRARKGSIIVGSAQKWLGSPLPLGFAIMPTRFLDADPALSAFIGSRDYLGASIQPREGIAAFPDTYSAPLAPVLALYVQRALGVWDESFRVCQSAIESNRVWLEETIAQSASVALVECTGVRRGMVAAKGKQPSSAVISQRLSDNGFEHSLFGDYPESGWQSLRLSAPTVPLAARDKDTLRTILGGSHV